MNDATTSTPPRDVRDVYGRRYRIGEHAHELTGHSRRWQLWAAWACMVAISPLQYSFGSAALGLQSSRAWGAAETMWLLALFVACQALVAIPAAWAHRTRRVSPTQLVVGGGILAAVGLVTLAHADSYLGVVLGYAVVGGAGAGVVYSACITTAARWFPERRTSTIGFVTGGFAVGAVPSIALLAIFDSAGGLRVVFDLAALLALLVVIVAGGLLKDPPRHWWPADIDAQAWAVDRKLNRSIPHNLPAVRYYRPAEAMRTGALPLMWLTLALSTALSLFGIAFVVSYAVQAQLGAAVAGLAAGMLAAVNGLGRSFAGTLSDRFGRRRVLAAVLAVEGCTHIGLVLAGEAGAGPAFVLCAMFAGLGGGAFYAIMANLVLEFFGENSLLQNQAILYSAKAVGGLLGIGVAASLVAEVGYRPLFLAAGLLGLVTALTVRFLKQPGRPALPVRPQLGTPVAGAVRPGE
ncbi:major facilitator superfamily MFS_1 [Kribbella flavida DSM 17836]|uniref:Major facilitator superfamily MFS_1 n=1 Tax=Kribbella flavida (strain DSM 17836 / JCM 10339 / NBRC 14399) TaxID=479435 RepID=D2PS97_KRIFD|nr:MFS transporter [Kribbella flavida]ADB31221.1 major facilitator superfamily MFS_1 [Kribbella flavida DSM 17836]